MSSSAPPPLPAPGWYPDPSGVGQRWWDGQAWGPASPPPIPAAALPVVQPQVGQAVVVYPRAEKSSGLALLFLPVTLIIWVVTLAMTVGSINQDTETVNRAIREGRRITEV